MDFDIELVEDKCICIKEYYYLANKMEYDMWFMDGEYYDYHYQKPSKEAIQGIEPWDGHYCVRTSDEGNVMFFTEKNFVLYFKPVHFLVHINPVCI